MDTITFQDFLLKLSLQTSIIKHNTNLQTPNPSSQKGIQKIQQKIMDQNLPLMAKKLWHTLRVVYFMLRKNITKPKLFTDLNLIMKRGKIAGKTAILNLMSHHHHPAAVHGGAAAVDGQIPENEYEFSCSNTPAHHAFRLPFHLNKRKRAAAAVEEEVVEAAMEVAAASPGLPGFGGTPAVRQLRVTDSPYPVGEAAEGDDRVDEAAEEFIMRFYRDLKRQNIMGS